MAGDLGNATGFHHHGRVDGHHLVEREFPAVDLCQDGARHRDLERAAHRKALIGIDQDAWPAAIETPCGDADDALNGRSEPRDFGLNRGRIERVPERCQ